MRIKVFLLSLSLNTKFDFDDSLQGHLRFDSLVETEAFFLALKVKKTTSGLRISLGEVVG